MDAVPPGSFLAVTHPARDQIDIATKAEESLTKSMGQKVTLGRERRTGSAGAERKDDQPPSETPPEPVNRVDVQPPGQP